MAQIIHEVQDMTYLSWSKVKNSSGTAGSFLKAQEKTNSGKIYYKLSSYDTVNGITGHESVNEIISDRLLSILGIPHLPYDLIHADISVDNKIIRTWICASKDFRLPGERKLALDVFYQINRKDSESPLEFCIRNGWAEYVYQMLVFDYLILNRDRHGANIEVLENKNLKSIRLAPLFDHGVSLLCRTLNEEALDKEDVMADRPIQCFVGSRSSWDNLKLIHPDSYPKLNPLRECDKEVLLEGLEDALDKKWLDKIWEMIWRRWQAYEDLCNKR